ncbi:monocarboxylate transporter 10 [Myotis lucifugus]|uniref:monocarboxylate transporter 10 n=1 Tax=Myotis lucifugus TaxID=59463 RepID=UPI000CCC2F65|nr:monocarboxylate transporter 10 [Myotis lucifugus]
MTRCWQLVAVEALLAPMGPDKSWTSVGWWSSANVIYHVVISLLFFSLFTAWVSSLSMGMIFFCCPIVSIFTDIFGCRKTAVVGAAIGFIGLMSSSFVSSIEPLYLTYGIIFASGCSFAYQPSLVILGHYFKKRLGLVNGIVTAGSSLFTILLPLLLRVLTENLDLFYTLRILCIFMFVLFLAGFTYRPLVPSVRAKESGVKGGNRSSLFSRRKFSPPKKIFNFAIFKVTAYAVWAVGIPLALFGYFVPYVHLVKHVNERFKEETNKEVVLMCIGITSGVGRLLFGRIADYVPGVKKVYLQVLSFVFIGLMSMMIPLCSVFGALIAVCLIMGLFDGCFISIMAPIAFELVGAQDVSQAIGFLLGFMSIPMTVGPPIAGFFVRSWVPMTWHSTSLGSLPLLEVLSFALSHGSIVRSKERSIKPLQEKRWRKCWRTRTLCCQVHLES